MNAPSRWPALRLAGCLVVGLLLFPVSLLQAEEPFTPSLQEPAASSANGPGPLAAIGWRLFGDGQLSRPGNYPCASCHQPDRVFGDGLELGHGVYGSTLRRHTPRLANLAGAEKFYWDGRANSLEEQVLAPLTHPEEMDMTADEIVARVGDNPAYREAFSAIDRSPIVLDDVLAALAAFVRSLETGTTTYDRWLAGEGDVLSPAASRGRQMFFTRAQCATCHLGPALTDHDFHNIGTGTAEDLGRFEATGKDIDRGRFKTPSLRNWRGSEPFMHDGRFTHIEQVLAHYSSPAPLSATAEQTVGSSELDPLELSDGETQDLLAFLEVLNGAPPNLEPYQSQWRRLAPSDPGPFEDLETFSFDIP